MVGRPGDMRVNQARHHIQKFVRAASPLAVERVGYYPAWKVMVVPTNTTHCDHRYFREANSHD
jgi:hypothetical protein